MGNLNLAPAGPGPEFQTHQQVLIQTPPRVPESCRPIAFVEVVTVPREAVVEKEPVNNPNQVSVPHEVCPAEHGKR
jgi:hypothetical protein